MTIPGALLGTGCSGKVVEGANNGRSVAAFPDGSWVVTGRFESTKLFGTEVEEASLGGRDRERRSVRIDDGEDAIALRSMGNEDIFLSRHAPDGALHWARCAGGAGSEYGEGVAALPDGSCVVTGRFEKEARFGAWEANDTTLDSEGKEDVFLARYDRDGSLVWARRAGGSGTDFGQAVATFPDGTFVVAGRFESKATFGPGESGAVVLASAGKRDAFVARYSPDGQLLWSRRCGGSGLDYAYDVAALGDGSCVVTGYFEKQATFSKQREPGLKSAGGRDVFVARYDTAGDVVWAKSAGGPADDTARGIAALPDGSCVFTGRFGASAVFGKGEKKETTLDDAGRNDAFVARLDPSGALLWARRAGGIESDFGRAIASSPDGSCTLTGYFRDSATFGDAEDGGTVLVSAGGLDLFVARYGPDGRLLWARADGGIGPERGYGIDSFPDGACVVVGGKPLSGMSILDDDDLFVARYAADGKSSRSR